MAQVFVIEHDPEFADCLNRILQADGFDVTCLPDIPQAIKLLPEKNPCLAIVDIDDGSVVKPGDIHDLVAENMRVPVIVTTVYRTAEMAYKALGAGASDYLLKPFGSKEILKLIHIHTSKVKGLEDKSKINEISDKISFLNSLDDILRTTVNQLANTLHFADCLVALREDDSFRIQASRGYSPDPLSKTVRLSPKACEFLMSENMDAVEISSEIMADTVSSLGIRGNRPFPILMPLHARNGVSTDLLGFVLGHGAIVLEENDLLEMERYLNVVGSEIKALMKSGGLVENRIFWLHEGEYLIPETPREKATRQILEFTKPFLVDKKDTFWLRLAMDEAISNAIVHGHLEPLTKPVINLSLKYQISEEQISVTIGDNGNGFDPGNIPDPTADENLLSIDGRGIYLMRRIMDTVRFNEVGNQVTMTKKFDGNPVNPF